MEQINWDAYRDIEKDIIADDPNCLEFKDVLAMIIAMFQMVLPIAMAFMGVALLMMIIFKWWIG